LKMKIIVSWILPRVIRRWCSRRSIVQVVLKWFAQKPKNSWLLLGNLTT
jgi:hypothetical protein